MPASARVKSALNNFSFTMIDPVTVLDESTKMGEARDGFCLKKQAVTAEGQMRKLLVVVGIVGMAGIVTVAQNTAPRQPGQEVQGPLGPVSALGQESANRTPPPTGPAPRLPDGTIDLTGAWTGGGPVNDIAAGLPKGETLPLLPSSITLMEYRAQHETDDPHLWCMPMGVPRVTPYPYRFVQNFTHKAPTHLFILHDWIGSHSRFSSSRATANTSSGHSARKPSRPRTRSTLGAPPISRGCRTARSSSRMAIRIVAS